jgi:Xaa-Pro aminopeptidase
MDRPALRRETLRPRLAEGSLGGFLVLSPTNVSYLTGFTGDSSVLLVGRERDILISDGRYETQLKEECPSLEVVIREPAQLMPEAIRSLIDGLGLDRVAFESAHLSVAEFLVLRDALPRTTFEGVSFWVEELREIKDVEEIEAIRDAIQIAENAFEAIRASLRGLATEKEIADELEHQLRLCGGAGSSFPPIVAAGVRSALPHATPKPNVRVDNAEFVLIDWGACGPPYKSDLTRMVVTGKVSPTFETVYRTVLAAQERGIAAIRPGVRACDVDAEARSVIEEAGFGRFFGHGLGHGLGLEIHEAPRLRAGAETILRPGMVVTVEPGIYLPDWGGIRIEDDVLVTPDGCQVLTSVPKVLETVRLD